MFDHTKRFFTSRSKWIIRGGFKNVYQILFIICFPFLYKWMPVIFSGFADFVKNIVGFILLFIAFNHDKLRTKIFLISVGLLILFDYYYYNITNNIAGIIAFIVVVINKRFLKKILSLVVFFILFYPFIIKIYNQNTFGIPEYRDIDVYQKPNIVLIDNPIKEKFETDKYTIEINKVANIELDAKVVYVDHYDSPFHYDYYQNELYDNVAPLDLSVFVGDMALNWKNYKIKHEQRVLSVYGGYTPGEWENIHIIPANDIIHKGFKTVSRGDDVYLKGYLIDWNGLGEFDYFKIKSARSFTDATKERIGGNFTWLCLQFFVEELYVNGFTYK